eukprot:snap_masked-scaffold_15-processed-gene-2.59-mRNA-1 protein AED:1.00 eAED:1.00 QI:0/-1/0/0/-1/1/1/0/700
MKPLKRRNSSILEPRKNLERRLSEISENSRHHFNLKMEDKNLLKDGSKPDWRKNLEEIVGRKYYAKIYFPNFPGETTDASFYRMCLGFYFFEPPFRDEVGAVRKNLICIDCFKDENEPNLLRASKMGMYVHLRDKHPETYKKVNEYGKELQNILSENKIVSEQFDFDNLNFNKFGATPGSLSFMPPIPLPEDISLSNANPKSLTFYVKGFEAIWEKYKDDISKHDLEWLTKVLKKTHVEEDFFQWDELRLEVFHYIYTEKRRKELLAFLSALFGKIMEESQTEVDLEYPTLKENVHNYILSESFTVLSELKALNIFIQTDELEKPTLIILGAFSDYLASLVKLEFPVRSIQELEYIFDFVTRDGGIEINFSSNVPHNVILETNVLDSIKFDQKLPSFPKLFAEVFLSLVEEDKIYEKRERSFFDFVALNIFNLSFTNFLEFLLKERGFNQQDEILDMVIDISEVFQKMTSWFMETQGASSSFLLIWIFLIEKELQKKNIYIVLEEENEPMLLCYRLVDLLVRSFKKIWHSMLYQRIEDRQIYHSILMTCFLDYRTQVIFEILDQVFLRKVTNKLVSEDVDPDEIKTYTSCRDPFLDTGSPSFPQDLLKLEDGLDPVAWFTVFERKQLFPHLAQISRRELPIILFNSPEPISKNKSWETVFCEINYPTFYRTRRKNISDVLHDRDSALSEDVVSFLEALGK